MIVAKHKGNGLGRVSNLIASFDGFFGCLSRRSILAMGVLQSLTRLSNSVNSVIQVLIPLPIQAITEAYMIGRQRFMPTIFESTKDEQPK